MKHDQRTVEKRTTTGCDLRLVLEPLPEEKVRIVCYYRRFKSGSTFRRQKK